MKTQEPFFRQRNKHVAKARNQSWPKFTQNVQQCGREIVPKNAQESRREPTKDKKKERNAQQPIQDIISDFLPSLIHSLKSMITSSDRWSRAMGEELHEVLCQWSRAPIDDHEQWGEELHEVLCQWSRAPIDDHEQWGKSFTKFSANDRELRSMITSNGGGASRSSAAKKLAKWDQLRAAFCSFCFFVFGWVHIAKKLFIKCFLKMSIATIHIQKFKKKIP
jgi:hypothetical protein